MTEVGKKVRINDRIGQVLVSPTKDPFIKYLENLEVDHNTCFTQQALIRIAKRFKSFRNRHEHITYEGIRLENSRFWCGEEYFQERFVPRIEMCVNALKWLEDHHV